MSHFHSLIVLHGDKMKDMKLKYSVGPLLYTPALNRKIARQIADGSFGTMYSLALCLEDIISEDMVETAEQCVAASLEELDRETKEKAFYIPKLFIRVREPQQMERVFNLVRPYRHLLTGFIFPKYTVTNADNYNTALLKLNEMTDRPLYMMPILESHDLIYLRSRYDTLGRIRDKLDGMHDLVMNVRVGGNDFSNAFAARRHYDETIYDILPIAGLLGDILTFFSSDYVVSGPVWEFFSSDNDEWKRGLQREVKMDRLNGFIGKTVIHPKQIPVVNEMMKVPGKDYEDAKTILNWDSSGLQVAKSSAGERMNEVKTHGNWAEKTLMLASIYGVV